VDGSGNIYVVGSTSANGGDWFFAKYNAAGTLQWSQVQTYNSGGSQADEPTFIKLNATGTHLYICGYSYRGTGTGYDITFAKIDASNGNMVSGWPVFWTGSGAYIDEAHSMALDGQSDIYIVGKTELSSNRYDALILKGFVA